MNEWMNEPWVQELQAACEASSQAAVTRQLQNAGNGRYPSPAIVNQVLKGTYKGDIYRIQSLVEGVLMKSTVECPVIGEIPRQRCLEHQVKKFAATNPLRVQLSRECPDCPHSRSGQ